MKKTLIIIAFLSYHIVACGQTFLDQNVKDIEDCDCIRNSGIAPQKDWLAKDSVLSIRTLDFIRMSYVLDSFYVSFPEINQIPYLTDSISGKTTWKNFDHENTELGSNLTLKSLELFGGTITYTLSILCYNNKIIFKELKVNGSKSGIRYFKKYVVPKVNIQLMCRYDGIIWREGDTNNISFVNSRESYIEIPSYPIYRESSYFFNPLNTFTYQYCNEDSYSCLLQNFMSEYEKRGISFLIQLLKSPNPIPRIYAIEALQYLEEEKGENLTSQTKQLIDYHLSQKVEVYHISGCFLTKTFYRDQNLTWSLISRMLNEKN